MLYLTWSYITPLIDCWKWTGKELIDRECSLCGKLEDEYHVIIECPRYDKLRNVYIPQNLLKRPSMFKLLEYLNTENIEVLRAFGKFIFNVFNSYDKNFI